MKKSKQKLKKNAKKKSTPMNINIALNINSPLILNHQPQNLNDNQEGINGMKIEDASQQEMKKKGKRKTVLKQKLRNPDGFRNETASVQQIQAVTDINHISKTTLANQIRQYKGTNIQYNARLAQGMWNSTTDRSKVSHRSCIHQKNDKKNHQSTFKQQGRPQVLESSQFSKQLSSFKTCRYKSDFKLKASKNNLPLQGNLHSSINYTNHSANLETSSNQKLRNKSRKAMLQKRYMEGQQHLKDKLLKFRLDILKLQETYQDSEIYKSKESIRHSSPAFQFTTEPKDGADGAVSLDQITFFQKKYQSLLNCLNIDKQDISLDDQSSKQQKIGTLELVQYYQTCGLENQQESQQKHFSLLQLVQPITGQRNLLKQLLRTQQRGQKRLELNLKDFLAYMEDKNIDFSRASLETLESYVTSFKQQNHIPSNFFSNSLKRKPIDAVTSEDIEINREIQRIQIEKRRLARQLDISDKNWTSIDDWSYKYRLDLINLKRKMWGQYQAIAMIIKKPNKNQIYSLQKPHKLMKCLSLDQLSYQIIDEDELACDLSSQIHYSSLKDANDHEQYLVSRQQQYLGTILDEELSQNNSYLDELQLLQTIRIHDQQQVAKFSPTKKESSQLEQQATRLRSVTRVQKDQINQLLLLNLAEQFSNQLFAKRPSLVSKVIYHAKFLKKLKSQKRKGFQTGSNAVKAITQQLSQLFTSSKRIQDSPLSIRQQIISNLNKPCGPTSKEILGSLRYNLYIDESVLYQNIDEIQQVEVLSVKLFHQFQLNCINIKVLSFERYYEDEDKQRQRVLALRNYVHIHHKAIFDCFNEAFDYYRIFGIWGKPFLWKNKPSFQKPIEQSLFSKIIQKSKKKVFDNCKFVCGLLLDRENSLIKNYQYQPQLIQQLREQRAHKFLEDYNDQIDERWFFTDDDEAEIMLELNHSIWRSLISQMAKEITTISILKHR